MTAELVYPGSMIYNGPKYKGNDPISVSDFKKLIKKEYTFIDKTLFIKDIMEVHS